jgi:phage-related protein
MSDGKIIYDVEVNDDGIEGKVQSTNDKVQAAANTGSSAFGEVWTGALRRIGAGLVELGAQAVDTAKQVAMDALDQVSSMEQNIGGVQKLFGENAQAVVDNANQAFRTAGMSANEYMETVTGFSASLIAGLGGDTEAAVSIADRAITDMSDNANTFGTDISSIQMAYQGFAKQNYTMLDNLKLGYGGTKEEMQRLIADASQMSTEMDKLGVSVDADSMSFDNIINAISVMQEHLNIAGTTANEASGTIEGSINSLKAAWDNFLAGTLDGESLAEIAYDAMNNIFNAFMEIIPRLAAELPTFIELVGGFGLELAQRLIDTIGEQLPEFLAKGQELILNLAQGLAEGIPNATDALLNMITSFTEWLASDGGTSMIDSGMKLLESIVTGLANALPVLVEYIPQIILNIVTAIANNLPRLMEMGVNMIVSLLTGIIATVPKLIEQFPNMIRTIFTIWKSTNWLSLGLHLITAILQGITQLINAIPDLLKQIGNSAMDTFKSIDWLSLGSHVIDGIVDGIKDGISAVADAAREVAEAALDAAKSFLGIHSPSRAFKEQVGLQSDAGQAEGMIENADLVEDAAREVSQKALDASMDVNYNLPNKDTVSQDIGASFSSRVMQTVNRVIEVPLNISGREIARATAWDMGEQLAWESR